MYRADALEIAGEGLTLTLDTYKELESFQERIKAAKLLISGKTYEEIIKEANISSATLSRVSKCVKYGEGYKSILSKENKDGIE